jgi:hypothetical protein
VDPPHHALRDNGNAPLLASACTDSKLPAAGLNSMDALFPCVLRMMAAGLETIATYDEIIACRFHMRWLPPHCLCFTAPGPASRGRAFPCHR